MDKFTYEKYNIGVNHEHLCLALRRLNNIKLNNLTIKNKASSVDFHLPNSNIHIERKHRQLSSDDYIETLFEKTRLIFGFHQKGCMKLVYIYMFWFC